MSPIELADIPDLTVRENALVGRFTSIGIPCRARALVTAESNEGLSKFLQWAEHRHEPLYMMGGGTNLIFLDDFFDGTVLRLGQAFRDVKIHDRMIRAGCSIPLSRLLNIAIAENLTGLEFCWDVPGTLGGAVIGNAGAANESICPLIEAARGFDPAGVAFAAKRDGFEHGYRYCSLRGLVLTEIIVALEPAAPEVIQQRLQSFKETRYIQPVGVKSCGCIFKNPEGEPAGKLIDEAGLKGHEIGGVKVSPNHANFFINFNKATSADVEQLIEYVREVVRQRHNVELELEAQIVRSP